MSPDPPKTGLEIAQGLEAQGKSPEEILASLVSSARASSPGPLPVEEEAALLDHGRKSSDNGGSAWGSTGTDRDRKGPSQATRLVELARDADLFLSPDGQRYASVPMGGHRETWALKSRGFRDWLARRFYLIEDKAPSSQALQNALSVLEGKARFEGPEVPVHIRVAAQGEMIYIDLANAEWEAIEISRDGWRILKNPPVKFRRPKGLLPLPTPEPDGTVDELRRFVNLPEGQESSWKLLVGWLIAALKHIGPFPVLVLHGEQGSAKSTVARMVRALIDPSAAPLRAEPREVRDLMIAANNGWIISLDNVSRLWPVLSDALCRLSSGGGFTTRELYTDDDEAIFAAQRPVMLNGIEEIATREDLLDRAVILYLPPIAEENRRPESELWREFEAARPRILGALLDAVVAALRNLPEVHLSRLPRMADFAMWATAAEAALGWEKGAFLAAYMENRRAANELALDSSPVAPLVLQLVEEHGTWSGTVGDLLKALEDRADEATRKQKVWPKSASALSNALRRLAPNLRASGVQLAFLTKQKRGRPILLEWTGTAPSPPSSPSPPGPGEASPPHSGTVSGAASDEGDAIPPSKSPNLVARVEEVFG